MKCLYHQYPIKLSNINEDLDLARIIEGIIQLATGFLVGASLEVLWMYRWWSLRPLMYRWRSLLRPWAPWQPRRCPCLCPDAPCWIRSGFSKIKRFINKTRSSRVRLDGELNIAKRTLCRPVFVQRSKH